MLNFINNDTKKWSIVRPREKKINQIYVTWGSGEFTLARFAVTECATHHITSSQYAIVANFLFFSLVFQFHQPTKQKMCHLVAQLRSKVTFFHRVL